MTKSLAASRITIVGLGLMGGSLAGALKGRCKAVVGVDARPETLAMAKARELVDETMDLRNAVSSADIVVLATPVRVIMDLIPQISPWMAPGALLMDLGSTKGQILQVMAETPEYIEVLGGHPMCGKELSGIEAADPALFRERTFILSPLSRTSEEALALGRELVLAIGALPLLIEGERQDYLVGTLSHLPYLLACSLVSTADATTSADPLAWQIVAGGYRDTSRVAGSDVEMWVDILTTNREHVVAAAEACQVQLARLVEMIESDDKAALGQALAHIRQARKEMFP
jgi:prephenate dehydrogenase